MNAEAGHPVALITGAAVRLGAQTASTLHANGYNVIIHCHHSLKAADDLCDTLNNQRGDSACVLQADLSDLQAVKTLAQDSIAVWKRLDVLVNNASAFFPTPLETASEAQWDTLFGSNAKAPLFLASALSMELKSRQGCIINMSDLYAGLGLRNHSIYTMAKAALEAMTRSLARELAPDVRVNAIAPGAILWPFSEQMSVDSKQKIIEKSALKKLGSPADIANAVLFLVEQGTYITGQVLHVDGGR